MAAMDIVKISEDNPGRLDLTGLFVWNRFVTIRASSYNKPRLLKLVGIGRYTLSGKTLDIPHLLRLLVRHLNHGFK